MNYGRYCSINAEAAGGAALNFSNPDFTPALRARFSIRQWTLQTPNLATIRIANLLPQTAQAFVAKEYTSISIDAGYQDNHGIIFQGNIIQSIYGRENPTDTLLTIICGDGDKAHNYAVVNTTLAAGSTPKDHVDAALSAMAPLGVTPGYIDPSIDLTQPKYPRSVVLYGMARDVLNKVAQSKNATSSYQNEQHQMLGVNSNLPGAATVLNSQTGLLGMPTQEIGGVMARIFINPALKINSLVQIDQSLIQGLSGGVDLSGTQQAPTAGQIPSLAADGIYKIYQIDVDGDTRGNPWFMDIACLAANGAGFTPAAAAAALSGPT